jgi:hypothetical protein
MMLDLPKWQKYFFGCESQFQTQFKRFVPPSLIRFCQTQRLFLDASTTKKLFVLGAILDFSAILDFQDRMSKL